MDLLAPIDPVCSVGSSFALCHSARYRTWEGYNYLGAGVVMLTVMLLPSFSPIRLRRLTAAEVVPLALACLALTALAVSTKISAGSVLVVDLDPREVLTKYLAVFAPQLDYSGYLTMSS